MENDLHLLITKEALARVKGLPRSSRGTDLVTVEIDVWDSLPRFYEGQFYKMNHDSPGAQKNHFMRNQGQSLAEAHRSAVNFMKDNASLASSQFQSENEFSSRSSTAFCAAGVMAVQQSNIGQLSNAVVTTVMLKKGQIAAPVTMQLRSPEIPLSICSGAWPLGLAAHALEDSFSPAHVVRHGKWIKNIKVYATQDHDDHDEKDASRENFDTAVDAVVDLFTMVRDSIKAKSSSLIGWGAFEDKWLRLRPNLELTPLTALVAKGIPSKSQKPLVMSKLTSQNHHIVRSGESLSVIAGAYYQDMLLWPHVFEFNRPTISNPNHLTNGMVINIPAAPEPDKVEEIKARGRNWRSYNLV